MWRRSNEEPFWKSQCPLNFLGVKLTTDIQKQKWLANNSRLILYLRSPSGSFNLKQWTRNQFWNNGLVRRVFCFFFSFVCHFVSLLILFLASRVSSKPRIRKRSFRNVPPFLSHLEVFDVSPLNWNQDTSSSSSLDLIDLKLSVKGNLFYTSHLLSLCPKSFPAQSHGPEHRRCCRSPSPSSPARIELGERCTHTVSKTNK